MPSQPPATVTFVGTAITVLRIGEFTLLTDPNFLHAGQTRLPWIRDVDPAADRPGDEHPGNFPASTPVLLSHLHGTARPIPQPLSPAQIASSIQAARALHA